MRLASWVLIAAVVAGTSYAASWALPITPGVGIAWKGSGVALLALYAALTARGVDGWLLTAVMAFGAAGDVLLETHGLTAGALAFLAGHLTAICLYLRNRRARLSAVERIAVPALAAAIVALAFALPADRASAPAAALYAAGLGGMAAAAWTSRFPRRMTALGAMMFVVSDLLIFARTGRPIAHAPGIGLTVWGLYLAGQTLIVLGVTRATSIPPRPDRSPHTSRFSA